MRTALLHTAVMSWIEIERENAPMRTYVVSPKNATESTPTVVLAMHLYGLDRCMREAAQRFADAGFSVAVPDLYARFDAPDGDVETDYKTFVPIAQKLNVATVDPDIRAAAAWLKDAHPKTKTAIAGFCMGGVMAMHRSTREYADIFTAAAVWYGAIRVDPNAVAIPVVGSYGSNDNGIPVDDVIAFRHALKVPNDIAMYPNAGHAFCDDTRPAYEKNAADDSWQRSLAFLHDYLG